MPHFKLHDDAQNSSEVASLQQVKAMFRGTVPATVIEDVFASLGPQPEPCIEALLAMSSSAAPAEVSSVDDHGATSSHSVQPAKLKQHGHASFAWADLPDDCKLLIMNRLAAQDLAKIAQVSKSMAAVTAHRRSRTAVLRVKCGLGGLHHCVAAHPFATKVCILCHLVPLAHHLECFSNLLSKMHTTYVV